jgi:hypothetical protein
MSSTIRLTHETKQLISTYGLKGESFETIIKRLYYLAEREQLREFLMPSDKYISLDEFEKEIGKKWPKSR